MDNSKQFLVSKNFLIIIIKKRNCLVIKLRKKFFPYTRTKGTYILRSLLFLGAETSK